MRHSLICTLSHQIFNWFCKYFFLINVYNYFVFSPSKSWKVHKFTFYILDRHLQRFWGASGDFWQAIWDLLLDSIGEDPVTLWVIGMLAIMLVQIYLIYPDCFILHFPFTASNVVTLTVYWLFGAVYTILDFTNKPAALRRYKIQPGTNEPVDKQRLLKVWDNFYLLIIIIKLVHVSLFIIFIFVGDRVCSIQPNCCGPSCELLVLHVDGVQRLSITARVAYFPLGLGRNGCSHIDGGSRLLLFSSVGSVICWGDMIILRLVPS